MWQRALLIVKKQEETKDLTYSENKETENPKKTAGDRKLNMALLPPEALRAMSRVLQSGAAKYGPWNWRVKGQEIEESTYHAATLRHLTALMDGEDLDPESGESHWAHIAASAAIVLDALELKKKQPDEPPANSPQ